MMDRRGLGLCDFKQLGAANVLLAWFAPWYVHSLLAERVGKSQGSFALISLGSSFVVFHYLFRYIFHYTVKILRYPLFDGPDAKMDQANKDPYGFLWCDLLALWVSLVIAGALSTWLMAPCLLPRMLSEKMRLSADETDSFVSALCKWFWCGPCYLCQWWNRVEANKKGAFGAMDRVAPPAYGAAEANV